MSRKCGICGSEGADILCTKCRSFVCEDCFDADADACVKCVGKARNYRSAYNHKLLVGGAGFIVLGIVLTAWALIGSSDSTIVLFPFVFTNVSGSAAFIISMAFFALFTVSSLLPVYLMLRRGSYSSWDEGIYTIRDSYMGGNVSETIEFMITTEVPKEVEGSVYIEEDVDRLRLISSKDPGFSKTYDLPPNTEVADVESDYEGSFLLVRVKLRKSH